MTDLIERYSPIVDDPAAWKEALERPLPACVWMNPERTTAERLEELMSVGEMVWQPLAWRPGAYRLGEDVSPGNRLEYLAGLYYVQEEVSLLPVHLLDPQPGERVLDLCAAPGNKTAQMALAVGREGTVVANDRGLERTSILRRNVGRLGFANVVTTIQDAAGYPPNCGLFDRVLADVPCSCEGTSRKFPSLFDRPKPMAPGKLAGLQVAILRKAVQLCRPGGRIVYSTCTYAPEENEAVVSKVLQEADDGTLRLLPARIEGFDSSPGLKQWQGKSYHPDLELALRAWPHQNDTGGFFVAVLEKTAATGGEGEDDPLPPQLEDATPHFQDLVERFGLPQETFQGLGVQRPNTRQLALVTTALGLPRRPKVHTVGLPFLYPKMGQPKPTSSAALILATAASRNVITLNREQTDLFLHRQDFDLAPEQAELCDGPGQVLVRYEDVPLGMAGLSLEGSRPRLASLFPKGWALAAERSAFA